MIKDKELSIAEIATEVKTQLSNQEVAGALLATTFKGLDTNRMALALREGMIAGFTFQDFMKKDVYAIPFNNGYSLVTSIDYSRKIAMRSGLCGKTEPVYTYNPDGSIETCSVTVKRLVNGHVGEYSAKVFFKEYTTGKNLWVSKPHTMIAKVAEMHALRMAFPEEMAKQYVEEEFAKPTVVEVVVDISDEEKENVIKSLDSTTSAQDLVDMWASLTAKQRNNKDVKIAYETLSKRTYEPVNTPLPPKTTAKTKKTPKVEEGEVDESQLPPDLK